MKICPNCGTETTDTARFCRKCGTNIEAEPILEAPAEETPDAEAPAEEIPDAEAPAEEAPIAEEAAEEPVVEAAAEEPKAIEAEEAPDEEDVPEEGPVEEETEPAEEEAPEEEAPEEEAPEEEAPEEEDVPEEEPAEEDETATDEIADGEPEDEQTKEGEPSLIAALERMVDKEPAEEPEEEPEEEPAEEPIEEPIAYREPTEAEDGSIEFDWNQPVEVERPEGGWQKGLGEGGEADNPADNMADSKEAGRADGVLFGGAASKLAADGSGADAAEEGGAEAAEYDGDGSSYEWGPPLGAIDGDDPASMVPIHIGSRPGEDEADEDYDGDYDEEYEQYRYETYGEWDHTDDFDPEDISENKVMAMAAYLLGPLGIIIALLAAQSSPFAAFHVRQSMKFVVTEALTLIVMSLLCWTLIVPAAGIIFLAVLAVVKIIAFVSVCKGRAVEPPIIRGLKFLK